MQVNLCTVGLASLLVGMGAEASHGLGFPRDALSGLVVQALGLYQGEGDVSV